MKMMKRIKKYGIIPMLAAAVLLTGCSEEDEVPEEEHEHEVITDVKLIFTNMNDASDIVEATAIDADGEGVGELEVGGPINLEATKTYILTFDVLNKHADGDVDDIGAEIAEEDDEHQIFFGFTDGAFTDPTGDGNIDNSAHVINYNDSDDNGFDVGLNTTWTAGAALTGGEFRVVLMHQPGIKTSSTSANDGDPDFDLVFDLNIN